MSDTFAVVMAGYQAIEPAKKDFDELVQLVKDKKVKSEGVILVEHDESGEVRVVADRRPPRPQGRWAGAAASASSSASPRRRCWPRSPSAPPPARIVGKFAKHKVDSGLEDGLGEKLKPGTAAIIAIVDDERPARGRAGARRARRPSRSRRWTSTASRGLKDALAEAAGKFSPDRTVLPIPDRDLRRRGRPHDRRSPSADWSIIPGPKAPEGAPNVLLVLIDDAGFGGPDTFGGGIATPNLTRVQQMGLTYNRFHVTAVCSPTRAALLTGRNHHRVGMGGIAEFPGPFPGYTGHAAAQLHRPAAHPQGERLRHRRLRQVAHDAGPRDGRGRPVRPLAARRGASTTGGAS